ncbi:MAG: hypothetical protein IJN16_05720 [Lachnospiraceae bacterium]|nr:hypothetical protein [Lachnospiraceae bacterium]
MADETMTKEEMISILIDKYADLMRIKKAQQTENSELNYQITVTKTKLQSFGVNTEDLEHI